ncbi:nicotinamide riboside transporter PnuC [Glutamicibacter sp. MNS18]|uniref:nicotinamide riboside transporter PnuC n=1 Tax=Glutamicibacter sp. MNS18 TaxID=2989817 RepID=UPI0022369917|nr:nicotinamide riboside transporter PnuC [Glutamicibacter sp. MNS18]MCW4464516.1 nicotinamide riboside transporter PnuC [Glutamicibacter sp. MNS18]
MDFLRWLIEAFDSYITIGSSALLVREVVGNIFGLASAFGGMRRKVWAWPVGIIGNLLLLTVFLGSLFGNADTANLLGQAGRQIMFIAVAVYGWVRWKQAADAGGSAVTPRWASKHTRIGLVAAMIVGTIALTPLFRMLGSYEPVWADAWTFVGSLLATWGMAKGWVEFWLIWVAVDVVGVPLLFSAGYYASAFMYLFYGVFTLVGFFVWMRAKNNDKPSIETEMPDPRIQAGSK